MIDRLYNERKWPGDIPGRRPALMLAALLLLSPALLHAQPWEDGGADAVESFRPGTGAGHGAEHLPGNVLGLPDSSARDQEPVILPEQILSLGMGGEIVLRFDRHPIVDRPGADFTVFENAFHYTIGGRERLFAEPAEVAVSRDGIEFIAFPFDSLTLAGCAGITPTNGDRNPGDPAVSGGDCFDIGQLGLDSVRYVRLRDMTAIISGNRQHPFWDPTLTGAAPNAGFDLDAVVRVTVPSAGPSGVAGERSPLAGAELGPNPFTGQTTLRLRLEKGSDIRVRLFDQLGRQVREISGGRLERGEWRIGINPEGLPPGVYFALVEAGGSVPMVIRAVYAGSGR